MALKATVASLDEVAEAAREFYKEGEGGFVLQVDGIGNHPEVGPLKRSLDTYKKRVEENTARLKAFGEHTPEGITELVEELEGLRTKKGDGLITPEELKDLRERLKDATTKAVERDKLAKDLEFYEKDSRTRLKREVSGSLAAAGLRAEAIPAAAALILAEHEARYERGEDGFTPVVRGEVNGVPGDHGLDEFVKAWAAEKGAIFMPPTGKGGGGASPDGGGSGGGGGRQVHVKNGMVRVNPKDVIDGKTTVVQG